MVDRKRLSLREIRQEGLDALLERLGPVGTIRFPAIRSRARDYTQQRHRWLDGVTVTDFVEGIKRRKDAN